MCIRDRVKDAYTARFSARIELQPLQNWQLGERFALVQQFLINEAAVSYTHLYDAVERKWIAQYASLHDLILMFGHSNQCRQAGGG